MAESPAGHLAERSVGVVGGGLIGGSIVRGLLAAGLEVALHDTDRDTVRAATEHGATPLEVAELLASCDLVVLAVAPRAVAPSVIELTSAPRSRATWDRRRLLLDVSSVKAPVVDALAAAGVAPATDDTLLLYTHPMAGREVSGWGSGDAQLFAGAAWIVCPTPEVAGHELAATLALIGTLDARAAFMDPVEHDRFAATVSHLPHVLSFAFDRLLAERDPSGAMRAFAGGALRDVLRVAEASPALWSEILAGNRAAVEEVTTAFITQVHELLADGPRPGTSSRSVAPTPSTRVALPLATPIGARADELIATGLGGREVADWQLDVAADELRLRLAARGSR